MQNTVKGLIRILQALLESEQELPVELEGCDCIGTWDGKEPTIEGHYILLGREAANAPKDPV